MDHRWDELTWQDRAARAEQERFGASRIAQDLDVERRDRICARARRASSNLSPWEIGVMWHDQRDLYTRNSSVDADGYGRGSTRHSEDGSYAPPAREFHPGFITLRTSDATLYQREAWPWLNYKEPASYPYFSWLRAPSPSQGLWARIRHWFARWGWGRPATIEKENPRSDRHVEDDVLRGFAARGDLDTSDVDVIVQRGEVTLRGTVIDRRSRRVAQKVAEKVQGVDRVRNLLTIRRDDPSEPDYAFVLPFAHAAV